MATGEQWQRFNDQFSDVVNAYLEREEVRRRIAAATAERAALMATPTTSMKEQIASVRAEALMAIDAAEAEELHERVRCSDTWKNFIPNWTMGTRIREAGGAPMHLAFNNSHFRQHETGQLVGFEQLRKLVLMSCEYAQELADKAGDEGVPMPETMRRSKLAKADKTLSILGERLTDLEAQLLPFYRGGRDQLPGMLEEYAGAQAKASFPIKPVSRLRTSKAWGDVTRPDHPDAAEVRLEDDKVAAWQRLSAHFAAMSGIKR